MKIFLTIIFILSAYFNISSQSIWTNPITGMDPNTANPFTNGQTVNANITVSGIGRGSGINGNIADDRYNANSWNTTSIDLTAYFEFTLAPNSGYELDLISFVYTGQASGTGPGTFEFRSSIDGYTSSIGSPTATGATINLSGSSFQNLSSGITFRLYGWGASASGGTFSVNSFTFNGTVSMVPVPIVLISFKTKIYNKSTNLNWITASETNNDYFTIERSGDGRSFDVIGKIDGAGNSSEERNYDFTDDNPLSGIN